MDIQAYLELPWSLEISERHDDGRYYVARVDELPGLVATGEDPDQLVTALWEALADHIRSYLEDGEQPPLPDGAEEILRQRSSESREAGFDISGVSGSVILTTDLIVQMNDGRIRRPDREFVTAG